ncbi:nuclear condensing complex subunit [Amylocystis lapponica]|nr:nuclear condensing complex subunit [Amylocystis lapponica]
MPAPTSPFRLDSLHTAIPRIFDQAQSTTANHHKNHIALYKLQTDAAAITQSVQNGKSLKLTGEREFQDVVVGMLARVLPLKKGTTVADRIVKFLAGYTKFINEKVADERKTLELDDDDDTPTSRFVSRILKFLLSGCPAKDKNVRFRVIQCLADMILYLGEVDEEQYLSLRSILMERVRDKEPTIRVQAVAALAKLSASEDVSELDDDEPSIAEVLIDTLTYDTSPDVRRAALVNLPLGPHTLPPLLARTRDIDATVRRLVYASVLEPHCVPDSGAGLGFTHPRALTIAQREIIVRNGLGDREDAVKTAAGKLMGVWVDVVREGAQGKADNLQEDMLAFLALFDLAEGTIAEDALTSVFTTRIDIFDNIEFGDEYWTALTPEKAFLARVFVEQCITMKDNARLESVLPVVTALAFRISEAYNELLEAFQEDEEDALLRGGILDDPEEEDRRARRDEARMDREFTLGEMMRLAVNLDYADEIGRRKMFQLIRDMISQDALPEGLVARCLDVLRTLSPNERDLIRVVVEVVHELRDPSEPEEEPSLVQRLVDDAESEFGATPMAARALRALPKPTAEMTPEERTRVDVIDMRCLSLCIGMLERVNGTFEENSTLEGILGELIIPAVKRKELPLREKGLVSLGLCCLIARRMALNSFQLFLSQVQSAPEVLKIHVLQIVFDILMVHEGDFLGPGSVNGERIVEFLLHLLENEESDKVQAVLCIGISKLMLSVMIVDERVLKSLMLMFISPETATNQELRQCLSYFFPVYCYSSPANQRRMQKIFIPLYEQLTVAYKEWDGDEEMITPAQVGIMFVDWTDPQKAVAVTKGALEKAVDNTIHVDLASDIVKALFSKEMEKEDKKALCQLLGKLHMPDVLDEDKLRTLKLLTQNLRSRRPLRDTVAQNAFVRFDNALSKKYAAQLEGFSEEEYRQLEGMKDVFSWLDEISEGEEEIEMPKAKRTTRKRSESVATNSTASGLASDRGSAPPSPRRKAKGKGPAKRRRLSQSDDESDDGGNTEMAGSPSASVAPTRVMPRRSA